MQHVDTVWRKEETAKKCVTAGLIISLSSSWSMWHNVTKFLSPEVMCWNVADKVFICSFIVTNMSKQTEEHHLVQRLQLWKILEGSRTK